MTSDVGWLSARLAADLSADAGSTESGELIADDVRGVLDEHRAALRLHGDASALEAAAREAAGDEPVTRALAAHARRLR